MAMAVRSRWLLLPAGWALLALGCPNTRTYPTPPPVPMSAFPGGSIADRSWDGAFPTGGATLHVAPGGTEAGDGSEAAPFARVQQGLDRAGPGDTVLVHAGTYREAVVVTRSGTADAYLRLLGDGAVLSGGVSVEGASYVVVAGLEVRDAPGPGIAVRGGHDVVVQ